MALPLIIAGTGIAMQMYGSYKTGKDNAAAMRRQAALDGLKAQEILERNKINIETLFKNAKAFQGSQVAQITGAGGGMGASAMALIEETTILAAEEANAQSRSAEWEANMVRLGAESTMTAAGDVQTAGTISALGTGLSGSADIYSNFYGKSANTAKTPTVKK